MEAAGAASPPETATVVATAEGASMEIHPPHAAPRSIKDFLLQLGTITTGVLIALSLEGLLEWNHYRLLVREARATIAREITDNKKEIDGSLKLFDGRARNLENAGRFATEMLKSKTSEIRTLEVGFHLPELSSASWRSAERTGALARMPYAEVQRYSRVYDFQELFAERERHAVEQVSAAVAVIGRGDPHDADPKDLEAFRQVIVARQGELFIERQMAQRLSEMYQAALRE
jgi:hypothetical protein